MRLQKLQSYKLSSNPDKQRVFACNLSVTFVTFATFLKFVTGRLRLNTLKIKELNKCNFVTSFFISSEVIFYKFFLVDFELFADFLAGI